jgi:hypothetical protein
LIGNTPATTHEPHHTRTTNAHTHKHNPFAWITISLCHSSLFKFGRNWYDVTHTFTLRVVQAEMQRVLWEFMPNSAREFRQLSTTGGCNLIRHDSKSRIVGDFELDSVLGCGRYGEVRTRE